MALTKDNVVNPSIGDHTLGIQEASIDSVVTVVIATPVLHQDKWPFEAGRTFRMGGICVRFDILPGPVQDTTACKKHLR